MFLYTIFSYGGLHFCVCTCSAQLSTFPMERRYRNTLIIIIIIIITIIIIFIIIVVVVVVVVVVIIIIIMLSRGKRRFCA